MFITNLFFTSILHTLATHSKLNFIERKSIKEDIKNDFHLFNNSNNDLDTENIIQIREKYNECKKEIDNTSF